ncbi:MAG: TetR/AcrR family transcriptional regulator [Acidobacteriaceae bacterium]
MPSLTPANRRAEITRKAILRAAIREFSTHGLAGARTDAIAQSAKVNKALLYYYFKSKTALYTAAIEEVAAAVAERALAALDPKHSPGERVLRTALTHFDRILTQRDFQSLMQHEMARTRLGKGGATPLLVKNLFKPMLEKLQQAVHDGIQSRELCPVDWLQVLYSVIGANVIFFVSAPMMREALSCDPLTPAAIAFRRRAALEFLGSALFVDRVHGAKLARRLLLEMPMPKAIHPPVWRKHV